MVTMLSGIIRNQILMIALKCVVIEGDRKKLTA
jgi:hypothetical protein